MHMHQVRYFLAISEEGSFVRAARRCGAAQPSLTRAIKLLEQEFGAALFHRDRYGTHLTDLGTLVRSDFAQIHQSAADAKRKAAKFLTTRSIATHRRKAMEASMRISHAVAILAAIIIGLGVKQFWLPGSHAVALQTGATISPIQMHVESSRSDLPAQEIHDLSVVYSDGD